MQPFDSNYLIIGASLIVIISYLCNILSRKTNIPSVLMLMLLGMGIHLILQNAFGFGELQLIKPLEILGTVGLIMIVLEAALDLKLTKESRPLLIKSLIISLLLLIVTSGGIAALFKYGLKMDSWVQALIYAIPLSVMSSSIVLPSVGSLTHQKKEFMVFEASFSDIFGIMFFYFLTDFHDVAKTSQIATNVIFNIIGTIVISLIVSYALIFLFQKIRSEVKLFLLVSSLLLLYASGKLLGISSLLIILTFGLILNNKELFFRNGLEKMIDNTQFDGVVNNFRMVTMETAFIVRTFFFVIFGMSIEPSTLTNPLVFVFAATILAVTYGLRFGALRTIGGKHSVNPELFISPRGLITVLLFYKIPEALHFEAFNSGIVLTVIIASSLIMTYGLISYGKSLKRTAIIDTDSYEEGDYTEEVAPSNELLEAPASGTGLSPEEK